MKYDLDDAVAKVSGVMKFENWLRFYFIKEEGEELYVRIPEESLAKMDALYPEYTDLVHLLNNETITYEKSVSMVCQHIVSRFDGKAYPQGTVQEIFDTGAFQLEMHLFNLWAQHHEAQLDQGFFEFGKWMDLFEEWKASEQVQAMVAKLKESPMMATQCATDAVH